MDNDMAKQVEEFGSLMFSIEEVATIIQVDPAEIVGSNELHTAYKSGQLKAAADVRASILKMARNGSTPAQKQLIELMKIVERKNKQMEMNANAQN